MSKDGAAYAPLVRLVGRFDTRDAAGPRFDWPGSTIEARFSGTEVTVKLRAQNATSFMVVVDRVPANAFRADAGVGVYQIAKNLNDGIHIVSITRMTEAQTGVSQFLGFDFGPQGHLLDPPGAPLIQMEVLGDSITAGLGARASATSCADLNVVESAYDSYAAVAARALGADLSMIAISGIGVYRNLLGKPNDPANPTLPQYYGSALKSEFVPYDFTNSRPKNVVVINLGSNDFVAGTNGALNVTDFTNAYRALIGTVRARYPQALIFCATPTVLAGQAFVDAVNALVSSVRTAGDLKVFAAPLTQVANGAGASCDGHPTAAQQAALGAALVTLIQNQL